jgi:predicted esterase
MSASSHDRPISRRTFAALAAGGVASFAARALASPRMQQRERGRLESRPKPPSKPAVAGERRLGLSSGQRDGILRIPPNPKGPLPLLVLFHGASSSAEIQLRRFGTMPDELGLVILAPDSRGPTWDAIYEQEFGSDVAFLDRALAHTFSAVEIDPLRMTLGGFSDGATYAISLGLINGDLFPRVLAFSPGFFVEGTPHGKPKFWISHGTRDDILPIERTSREIVPMLKAKSYDVAYREFDGVHAAPPDIARQGLAWAAARNAPAR